MSQNLAQRAAQIVRFEANFRSILGIRRSLTGEPLLLEVSTNYGFVHTPNEYESRDYPFGGHFQNWMCDSESVNLLLLLTHTTEACHSDKAF
jgi:hypothetical protein